MSAASRRIDRGPIWRRVLRVALGILLFVLGVIGLIVPLMPQVIFFVGSALVLAPEFPPARRLVANVMRRWPKMRRSIPPRIRRLGRRRPQ